MGRRLLRDEDFLDVLADVLDGVSVDFSDMTDDEYSSSGEYVVPVIATIVVATGIPTSGSMYWWVDYRFDANVVWEQSSL